MRATILLEQQHRQIEALINALELGTKAQVGAQGQQAQQGQQVTAGQPGEAIQGGVRGASQVLGELATALLGHMAIEEEIFYPSTMQIQRDRVLQNYIEHDTEVGVLRQLLATDPNDVSFRPLLRVLKSVMDQHVKAEEESLFPATEQLISAQHNEQLGQQMQARFNQVRLQSPQQMLVQRQAIELSGRGQQGQPQGRPQVQPQGKPKGQPQAEPQGQPQAQPQGQPPMQRQAKPKGPGQIR